MEPHEHQVLVDSVIVYFVPMKVEYVNETFKPKFFVVVVIKLVHYVSDFQAALLLILRFV